MYGAGTCIKVHNDDERRQAKTAGTKDEAKAYVWGEARPMSDAKQALKSPYKAMEGHSVSNMAFGPNSLLTFTDSSGKVHAVHTDSPDTAVELPFFGKKVSNGAVSYVWHLGGKTVRAKFVGWSSDVLYVVATDNTMYTVTRRVANKSWDFKDEDNLEVRKIASVASTISKLVCGDGHAVVMTEEGKVYSVGDNVYGQCGVGSCTDLLRQDQWEYKRDRDKDLIIPGRVGLLQEADWANVTLPTPKENMEVIRSSPTQVQQLQQIDPQAFNGSEVVDVAAGGTHTVFVTKAGSIFSCGLGSSFQLGQHELLPTSTYLRRNRYSVQYDPSVPFRDTPAIVSLPEYKGKPLKALCAAAGAKHNLVVAEVGTHKNVLVTWGLGLEGQLGVVNLVHMSYPKILPALQFSVEYQTDADGTEIQVPLYPIKVAAGDNHSVVLMSNGTVFTFGANKSLQCGVHIQKKKSIINSPSMLKSFAANETITDIVAGASATAAFGVPRH